MGVQGRKLKVNFAYLQVAEEIQNQIMGGVLKPGERLPGEAELAELFGVTRSTVREGLRQLESDGLVRRPTPRRLEVTMPTVGSLSTRTGRAMTLMQVSFRELWQVARETEPLAASLAAKYADQDDLHRLQDTHARLIDAKNDVTATIELDKQFHSEVAQAGKNRALILSREPIALLLYQGFSQIAPKLPQAAERQITAHQHILDSIRAGDAITAQDWARKHVEDFWRGVELIGLADKTPILSPEQINGQNT